MRLSELRYGPGWRELPVELFLRMDPRRVCLGPVNESHRVVNTCGGMESHPAEGRKEVGDACHGRESRRKGRSTATFCRAGCFLACFDGAQWRAKGIFDFAACHPHRLFVVPGTLFCAVSESECGYLESSHREPDLAG